MIRALVLPFLLQAGTLEITTSVDRARAGVGEVVTYTLRAVGRSTAPFSVELPPLDGFAIVDRRERTDIVPGRDIVRAFSLELELRAEQVGTWIIGPVRVEQGITSAFSSAETVVITSASAFSGGLEADMVALIPSVPMPRYGGPSVFVVPSATKVWAGDQVNVLTAAWLPRGLRLRLRQPPTLSPPALPGVWSSPRASVPGAVASRTVEGELYDLFVGFQTVYPLNAGTLVIPPARLSWTEPAGRQAGDDRRRVTESSPVGITVQALPDAGRPPTFAGPVARGLRVEYRLGQGAGRAGVVMPVDIVLSGAGNLSLWPVPQVAWPASARVYEEGSESTPRLLGTRIGGTRRFRFAIVPDSAGSLPLPPIEYAYFEPGDGSYRVARTTGIVVPVLEPPPVSERRAPLPVWMPTAPTILEQLTGLDPRLVALLAGLPVLAMLGLLWWRRREPGKRPNPQPVDPAAAFETLIHRIIAVAGDGSYANVEAALRRAGLDRRQAARLAELHRSVESEEFAPDGKGRPGPELLREIEGAMQALPARVRRAGGLAALLVLFLGSATPAEGQSALNLYGRREYAAAALAFRAEPDSPRKWYNVAVSEYMSRRDAHAVAALLLARANAPRNPRVRGLWSALAREHEQLRRIERVMPLTPAEAFLIGVALLWISAVLFAVLRRPIPVVVALALALGAGGTGLYLQRQQRVPRAVLAGGASLRVSPHGLAPERGTAPAFTLVTLDRQSGAWWLVATDAGARGWVPEEILAIASR